MKIEAELAALRRTIKKSSSPKVKANFERYFKNVLRFHGLKAPAVRAIARDLGNRTKHVSLREVLDFASALLISEYGEEKQIGIALFAKAVRRDSQATFEVIDHVFDRGVYDWATCDVLSSHVLRQLVVREPALRKQIVDWRKHANLWRQRASAVSFVNEARHGEHTREILTVCRTTVRNPERFVQLGTGWVLRELWLAEAAATEAFLRKNARFFSSEALRYATEKMPPRLAAALRDHRHTQAGRRASRDELPVTRR